MEDSAPSIWASMNSWFTPTVLFVFLNLMIGTILFTSNLPNHNTHHKQDDQKDKPQTDSTQSKLARSPSILHRLRSFNFHPNRSQQEPHQQQEALEIAATEYVFNHSLPHDHDLQPVSVPTNLDLNPTRFDSQPVSVPTNQNNLDLNPTRFEAFEQQPDAARLDDFKEVTVANAETRFVYQPKDTVEQVTTHFDFGLVGGENENPVDTGFIETHEEESDQFQSLDEVYSSITGGHVNRTKSDTIPASGEVPVKLPAKMKKSASVKSAFSHFEEEKIVEARRPATVRERRSAGRATEADDVEVDARADDFINKFKHQLKLQRLDSIIRYKDMVNRGSAK